MFMCVSSVKCLPQEHCIATHVHVCFLCETSTSRALHCLCCQQEAASSQSLSSLARAPPRALLHQQHRSSQAKLRHSFLRLPVATPRREACPAYRHRQYRRYKLNLLLAVKLEMAPQYQLEMAPQYQVSG